jgi:hypothetical protein
MPLNETVRINAFTGEPDRASALSAKVGDWISGPIPRPPKKMGTLGPKSLEEDQYWDDPRVGWGLILPDAPALSNAAKATADDAPEPIRRLLAHRQGVVLRWSSDLPSSKLRRYYDDGSVHDPHIALSERGTGKSRIPRYLLLYGSPAVLPWELQYSLSGSSFTGRLDLEGDELKNYVEAVITNWGDTAAPATTAVTWAVDHGGDDITGLMRNVIAKKVHKEFESDPDMNPLFLDGRKQQVTGKVLIDALVSLRPGMVLTTSHGMTGPLGNLAKMRERMGLPVDSEFRVLDVKELLERWSPDGAIWYAHACCSAGCDDHTGYEGLLEEGSHAAEILEEIAKCGPLVSPLPRLLLGAKQPLRAFIGHVEPTFDWTLKDKSTRQVLTSSLSDALYRRLYQPFPLGYAFESVHDKAPQLEVLHRMARRGARRNGTPEERDRKLLEAMTCRLVAQDLQSLVLLGDPAVLPALG